MQFGPLIDSTTLAATLGADDLIVFDATAYLPTDSKNGHEEYRRAHIPGAQFFDIDEFSDPDTPLPHMVPSQGRFARLAGAAGVGNNTRVVVYDQKGLASAARAWWLFRLFGHDRVAVLDGGLPKWLAEGRAVDSGDAAPKSPQTFQVNFRAGLLRGLGDIVANLDSRAELILDARSAERFAGTAPELRAGVTPGHIPGSTNLPYGELLNADFTVKSPQQLQARFAAAGIDGKQAVVTSCGSGVTAAVLSLGMVVAGLPQGALYDGSWTEWGTRKDTPKAT